MKKIFRLQNNCLIVPHKLTAEKKILVFFFLINFNLINLFKSIFRTDVPTGKVIKGTKYVFSAHRIHAQSTQAQPTETERPHKFVAPILVLFRSFLYLFPERLVQRSHKLMAGNKN